MISHPLFHYIVLTWILYVLKHFIYPVLLFKILQRASPKGLFCGPALRIHTLNGDFISGLGTAVSHHSGGVWTDNLQCFSGMFDSSVWRDISIGILCGDILDSHCWERGKFLHAYELRSRDKTSSRLSFRHCVTLISYHTHNCLDQVSFWR